MINEIKKALEKGTPGPWRINPWNGITATDEATFHEDLIWVTNGKLVWHSEEDSTLIANTPTYIRYLLDELEKAQKENSAMKVALEEIDSMELVEGAPTPEMIVSRKALYSLSKEQTNE